MDANIHEQVVSLAKLERDANARIEIAKAMRQRFYDLFCAEYDHEIEALERSLVDAEDNLKSGALALVEETGVTDLHPSLTFRRTTKLVYDKTEVFETLKREGATDCIRVKEELDVRAMEKAWKDGKLPYLQIESVNVPSMALGKLGDYLIIDEMQEKATD